MAGGHQLGRAWQGRSAVFHRQGRQNGSGCGCADACSGPAQAGPHTASKGFWCSKLGELRSAETTCCALAACSCVALSAQLKMRPGAGRQVRWRWLPKAWGMGQAGSSQALRLRPDEAPTAVPSVSPHTELLPLLRPPLAVGDPVWLQQLQNGVWGQGQQVSRWAGRDGRDGRRAGLGSAIHPGHTHFTAGKAPAMNCHRKLLHAA